MARYYLDTSALVKRYAAERGSGWITNLTDPVIGHDVWTVRLTGPEMIAALFRKVRTGEITLADAAQAASDFRADWLTLYQIAEVTISVTDRAMALAERHSLRGYDAVHLAVAVEAHQVYRALGLPLITFVSADTTQLRAAQAEGIAVDDPNSHS